MPTVTPSTRIQLAAGSVNCDPPKVDQERCPTPPKPVYKPRPTIKKTEMIYVEGDRDRSTITDCDQKFINGKTTEEEWKQQCFKPGTWNFERREQLMKVLENRKKFEESKRGFLTPLQLRIGTELAGRLSLYRDVYKNWNIATIKKEHSSLMPDAIAQPSNDGVIDQGNQFGARFAISTGPGLARLTDTSLLEATLLDLTIYNSDPSDDLSKPGGRGTAGKIDVYHSIWRYSFLNWGLSVIDTDRLWQKWNGYLSPLHIGLAQQLIGTPIGESSANKTVLSYDDFLQNYLLLGVNAFVAFSSEDESGIDRVSYEDTRRHFCKKTSSSRSDHCFSLWNFDYLNVFQKGSPGNEFYISTYLRGEFQNTSYGLSYKAHANVYPFWDKLEAGANVAFHLDKGSVRVLLDGATRKIWTYGEDTYGLPYSGYEYTLQLMLGYLPLR